MTTIEAEGTQTASINTEHELAKLTLAKVLTLMVDTGAMVAGDILELRIYGILRVSGTERLVAVGSYADAQAEPIKQSVPFPSPGRTDGYRVTLKQTAGTSRNFPWLVESV